MNPNKEIFTRRQIALTSELSDSWSILASKNSSSSSFVLRKGVLGTVFSKLSLLGTCKKSSVYSSIIWRFTIVTQELTLCAATCSRIPAKGKRPEMKQKQTTGSQNYREKHHLEMADEILGSSNNQDISYNRTLNFSVTTTVTKNSTIDLKKTIWCNWSCPYIQWMKDADHAGGWRHS